MRQVTLSITFRRSAGIAVALWTIGVVVLVIGAVSHGGGPLGQLGLGICIGALMISVKYLIDRQAELLRSSFERGIEVGRGDGSPPEPRVTRIR